MKTLKKIVGLCVLGVMVVSMAQASSNISFNSPLFYRFKALSMVESGDCDTAHGQSGEVSRFGITPDNWKLPLSAASNPFTAVNVAMAIMRDRCAAFENKFHRPTTDFEFYVLWHRPAVFLSHRIRHLTLKERARAEQFENLCQKLHSQITPINADF
jgi:hypothetical protein